MDFKQLKAFCFAVLGVLCGWFNDLSIFI